MYGYWAIKQLFEFSPEVLKVHASQLHIPALLRTGLQHNDSTVQVATIQAYFSAVASMDIPQTDMVDMNTAVLKVVGTMQKFGATTLLCRPPRIGTRNLESKVAASGSWKRD